MKHNTLKLRSFIATILVSLLAAPLSAEVREISDLSEVLELARAEAADHGPKEVLVVFDIDNTLLATKQNMGSDQWYEWQSEMIQSGDLKHSVAGDIKGLLSIQAKLYALSRMRGTQPDTGAIVKEIQDLQSPVIALTARGPVNRDATLRELQASDISMMDSSIGTGVSGRYFPLSPTHPHLYGLTAEEVNTYNLSKPREVSYEHGIMMVAGQHKGAMLKTLLHRTLSTPEVVIFVDDKHKNVHAVDAGLASLGIEVFALRYSKEDHNVTIFKGSDKAKEIAAWTTLSKTLNSVFE